MWMVTNLKKEPRSYSFESSGQGLHRDEALVADGVTLLNMMERVEWTDDPMQVQICTSCGYAHCARGDYVAVRRVPGFVVLVASTRAYHDDADQFDRDEYTAPSFMRQQGAPMIALAEWNRLRAGHAEVPEAASIEPLRWREALLLAQFEAPQRLLGEPGRGPREPLSKKVVAAEPALPTAELDRLGDIRSWARTAETGVTVRPASETRTHSLVIDKNFDEVVLFGEASGSFGLYFKPGLVLFPDG
jgi:hypothetical protein